MSRKAVALKIARCSCYVLFFFFCLWLFYLESTEVLVSDIPTHISQALDESVVTYSALMPLIVLAYHMGAELGVAVLLACIEVITLLVSEILMRRLAPEVKLGVIFVCALCCNIAIAIYVPFVHPYLTRGLSCGNAWHNSTYIAMRLLALLAIWAYLRFQGTLKSERRNLDWAGFTICCILSAAVKPSFMLGFGPAIVGLCVYDLVHKNERATEIAIKIAISFVLTLAVLAYQYMVLYVGDSSSGIELGIARLWRRFHHCVPFGMLQSYLLPLIVAYGCARTKYMDRNYTLAWVYFLISLFIYLIFNETGSRKLHSNFGWGLKLGIYYLMITSVIAFFKTVRRSPSSLVSWVFVAGQASDALPSADTAATTAQDEYPLTRSFEIAAIIAFALHTFSGVLSLISILMGNGYA